MMNMNLYALFWVCVCVLLLTSFRQQEVPGVADWDNLISTLHWNSLQGGCRRQGRQLGGTPALHQHHGFFHLHLVVEGNELRLTGAITGNQPLLHIRPVEAIQPTCKRISVLCFSKWKNHPLKWELKLVKFRCILINVNKAVYLVERDSFFSVQSQFFPKDRCRMVWNITDNLKFWQN